MLSRKFIFVFSQKKKSLWLLYLGQLNGYVDFLWLMCFFIHYCVTAVPDSFCGPHFWSVTLGELVQDSLKKSVTRCHHCHSGYCKTFYVSSPSVNPGLVESICWLLEWDILHSICPSRCLVIGVKAVWRYKES